MKRGSIGLTSVVLGMMILAPSAMAGTLVEFEGGIGVIPAQNLTTANVVRGVSPGGAPWVIRRFEAKVKGNGDIKAEGKGLILAGGGGIGGTPSATSMVMATLFCGPAATATAHSSGAVPLQPDGDFKIKNELTPSPLDPCTTPVLLIRLIATGNPWIAAGIPKLEEDDD